MGLPLHVEKQFSSLSETAPLYYEDSYLRKFDGEVLGVINYDARNYIVLDRTCFFPEGGGQLGDIGRFIGPAGELTVLDTQAVDDIIVHITSEDDVRIKEGDVLMGSINWDVRYERMKQHTSSHLLFSSIKRVLGLSSLTYMGVQIKEDTSRIDVSYGESIPRQRIMEIEKLCNKACLENKEVRIWFSNREELEKTYGEQLGLTEITPSGKVRVVEVEDWDVALCSGTHVRETGEIGLMSILDRFRLKKGVERIEFTAGKQAYQRYSQAMDALSDIAQTLQTSSIEAPTRVQNLLEEREILKKSLRNTREHLINLQTSELLNQTEALGELKLIEQIVPDLEIQGLKRIASNLVENDPRLIVVLGSSHQNKVSIAGAAGQNAVKKGVNMSEMIKKPAQLIQGGGGGSPGIAQAGGKAKEKLEEAVKTYAERVKRSLS